MLRAYARANATSLWRASGACREELGARASGSLQMFLALIEQLDAATRLLPLHEQVDHVIQASGLAAHYRKEKADKGEARLENLEELVSAARGFEPEDPSMSPLAAFLSHAVLESGEGQAEAWEDCVQMMTLHSAKGLEFPVVFLCGLEDGLFPHTRSITDVAGLEEGFVPIHHAKDSDDDVDEERRLLYVALTRAEEQLHCTWARSREFGSRSLTRKPSPWLEIVASTVGMAPLQVDRREGARRARNARSGSARQAKPSPDDLDAADAELFESLRAWRKQKAKEADVPAYVIFNDATLSALATARPSTRAQLLRVPGLGAVKAQRFGDDVLRIVAESA